MPIDEKLLAQITVDAQLKGTFQWEGNDPRVPIDYLATYLESYPSDSISEDISALKKAFRDMYPERTPEELVKAITHLSAGEFLLIPAGWGNASSGGHAMIYEFSKDTSGDLLFSVYNAGAGTQYHRIEKNVNKAVFDPALTFRIPLPQDNGLENNFEKKLEHYISSLLMPLRPTVHGRHKVDADWLYKEIFPKISFLEGRCEVFSNDAKKMRQKTVTAGQLSGTCAQRSVQQVLKARMQSQKDYRKLIYCFKTHALDEYLQTHPMHDIPTSFYAVLGEGIKHNLKLLKNAKVEQLFETSFVEKEHEKLQDYLKKLGSEQRLAAKKLNPLLSESVINAAPPPSILRTEIPTRTFPYDPLKESKILDKLTTMNRIKTIDALNDQLKSMKENGNEAGYKKEIDYYSRHFQVDATSNQTKQLQSRTAFTSIESLDHEQPLLPQLEKILEQCDTLKKQGHHLEIMSQLEQLLIRDLPLSAGSISHPAELPILYADISSAEKTVAFYEIIKKLEERYISATQASYPKCKLAGPLVTTIMILIRMRLLTLLTQIQQAKSTTNDQLRDASADYFARRALDHYKGSVGEVWAPYLATHDPKLDAEFVKMKEFWSDQSVFKKNQSASSNLNFFKQLLENNELPDMREALNSFFEFDLKPSYYFWSNSGVTEDDISTIKRDGYAGVCFMFENWSALSRLGASDAVTAKIGKEWLRNKLEAFPEAGTATDIDKKIDAISALTKVLIRQYEIDQAIFQSDTGTSKANLPYQWDYTFEKDSAAEGLWKKNGRHLDTSKVFTNWSIKQSLSQTKYTSIKDTSLQNIAPVYKTGVDAELQWDNASSSGSSKEQHLLRLVPQTQVQLTLDYYSRHLSDLSKPEHQNYIESNLFEPGLLLEQLSPDRATNFFKPFQSLIEDGVRCFQDKGRLQPGGLFLVRLECLVYCYAANAYPEAHVEKLEIFLQTLDKTIEDNPDENTRASLYAYQLMGLMRVSAVKPHDSEKHLEQALHAYLFINIHQNKENPFDADEQAQIDRSGECLRRLLYEKTTLEITPLLTRVAKKLGVELPLDCVISGSYPTFVIENSPKSLRLEHKNIDSWQFDIEQGLIFKNEAAYVPVPVQIIEHPIFQQLGLPRHALACLSPDKKTITVSDPPREIRFHKNEDYQSFFTVQIKGQAGFAKDKWYECAALSKEQRFRFMLPYSNIISLPHLPTIIQDAQSLAWICLDANEEKRLVLTQDGSAYSVGTQSEHNDTIELRRLTDDFRLSSLDPVLQTPLYAFEDPAFVTSWAKEGAPTLIELARYGLVFTERTDKTIHWHWEGSDYILQKEASSLHAGIGQLTWMNENKQQVTLFPVQRFLKGTVQDPHSAYWQFEHDRSNAIPNAQAGQRYDSVWQQADTQQYMLMKMDGEILLPETAEQALYACYLYLGSHQHNKAWNMLTICDETLGGLTGSFEECRLLEWINKALPYCLNPNDEKAIECTPQMVSCQLKALSMLTRIAEKIPDIKNPTPVFAEDTPNGRSERQSIQETRQFLEKINTTIYALYINLQKMRRDLPIEFTLSEQESWNLLDFYHEKNQALGALGYEYVQLQLAQLKHELQKLQAKDPANLSVHDKNRQQAINHFLTHHQGVSMNHRDVVRKNLNLEFATYEISRMHDLLDKYHAQSESSEVLLTALKNLNLYISDSDLINNFPVFLSIAQDPSSSHRQELRQFCEQALIGDRHIKSAGWPSKRWTLSNILYRFICLESKFDPDPPIADFKSFVDAVNKLPDPTPIPIFELASLPPTILQADDLLDGMSNKYDQKDPIDLSDVAEAPTFSNWIRQRFPEVVQHWDLLEPAVMPPANPPDPNDFFTSEEYTTGKTAYEKQCLQRHEAMAVFKASRQYEYTAFAHNLKSYISELSTQQQQLTTDLLTLAQKDLSLDRRLDISSNSRSQLDMEQLLTLYFQHDYVNYREATELSDDDIKKLHAGLANYVANGVSLQQAARVSNCYATIHQVDDDHVDEQQLYELAHAMFAHNLVDVRNDPELSIFQYNGNILLRPQQVSTITSLLAGSTGIAQVGMGGGKSKVILPTLAQKKATGENLLINEVPESLLRTNFQDLRATSLALFKQDAFIFDFNRDSDCSAAHLEKLVLQFSRAIRNKTYMVTTGEALQSLRLKYYELLHMDVHPSSTDFSTWKRQVKSLHQLRSLLLNRGDLIIDEVHQGLLLKNKLNYTLGKSEPITKTIINDTLELYQFFKHVPIELENVPEKTTLTDILSQRYKLTLESSYFAATAALAHSLVHDQHSPLHFILQALQADTSTENLKTLQQLEDYLNNKGDHIPEFIQAAPLIEQTKWALYKGEISDHLPFTLNRGLGEHYGPSKDPKKSACMRSIALPYQANTIPNENSRFGRPIEALNFTIQSMMIDGVPIPLLKELICQWQTEAKKDALLMRCDESDTSIAKEFKQISGISLHDLNTNDDSLLNDLSTKESVIVKVCRDHVLPSIECETKILPSDSFAHVSIVRSCQGVTGTPYNQSTFPESLAHDASVSKGSDGLVVAGIAAKKPQMRGIDFKDTKTFINDLFAQSSKQTRAIIDVNATFKGINNLTVTRALAAHFHEHAAQLIDAPQSIKYVLYFNEDNALCALAVTADSALREPIVLRGSNSAAIKQRLGCSMSECFTFYDQARTVGTDIAQDEAAAALVLVDNLTPLHSFLQGSMRMRGLVERKQRIDLVMPSRLHHELHTLTSDPYRVLINGMQRNTQQKLQLDNYHAARSNMKNHICANLERIIIDVSAEDVVLQAALFNKFSVMLAENKSLNILQEYGQITRNEDVKKLLTNEFNHLLAQWRQLLEDASILINEDMENKIKADLSLILERALKPGTCPEQAAVVPQEQGSAVETEQQQQKQQAQQQQQQQMAQRQIYASKKGQPANYIPWNRHAEDAAQLQVPTLDFKTLTDIIGYKEFGCFCDQVQDLKELMKELGFEFDDTIRASKNFYQTYQYETSQVDEPLRPVLALLFEKQGDDYICTLLTQEECAELRLIQNESCFICTASGVLLNGSPPEQFFTSHVFKRIASQVRFFNGELDSLFREGMHHQWINENFEKKMQYFKRELLPEHKDQAAILEQLKKTYDPYLKLFGLIIDKSPLVEDIDFRHQYPKCGAFENSEYRQAAIYFSQALTQWQKNDNPDSEMQPSPRACFGFMQHSLDQLQMISDFYNCFLKIEGTAQVLQTIWNMNTIDYGLIESLLQAQPLLKDEPFWMLTLAQHPGTPAGKLSELVSKSMNNINLRSVLLTNQALSEDDFRCLLVESYHHSSLRSIAGNPKLRDADVTALVAASNNHGVKLSRTLLGNRSITEKSLGLIFSDTTIGEWEVRKIFSRKEQLTAEFVVECFKYYDKFTKDALNLFLEKVADLNLPMREQIKAGMSKILDTRRSVLDKIDQDASSHMMLEESPDTQEKQSASPDPVSILSDAQSVGAYRKFISDMRSSGKNEMDDDKKDAGTKPGSS